MSRTGQNVKIKRTEKSLSHYSYEFCVLIEILKFVQRSSQFDESGANEALFKQIFGVQAAAKVFGT